MDETTEYVGEVIIPKEVTTRKGVKAIKFDFDAGGDYPQIGVWWADSENRWIPVAWMKDGHLVSSDIETDLDLID